MSIFTKVFSGINRQYILTFCSQMFALLLAVAALKLAAVFFDSHSFGLYNIVRRVITLINYPLLMGLGISIPIFVARGKSDTRQVSPYIFVALVFWTLATLLLVVCNMVAGKYLAFFLFNDNKPELVFPLILCFSSLYLYTIIYAIYRGQQNFWKANLIQIVVVGLTPIVALLLSGHSVFRFLYFMGSVGLFLDFIAVIDVFQNGFFRKETWADFKNSAREILRFGLPRVPGEFALFGLMSFPLFYIANYVSFEKAGYVAIGFTLVQLVASFFEFIGTLLLPKTTIMVADQEFKKLDTVVEKMLLLSVAGSVVISAFLYFNLHWILGLLDKTKFLEGISDIRVVIFCIPFYILYLILRNPIDAINRKPYNTFNLAVCFIIQIGILVFGRLVFNFVTIYTLSVAFPLVLLGVFTFIRWKAILKKHLD